MTEKDIKFRDEMAISLKEGVNVVCGAIAMTLGSDGRYVMIQNPDGTGRITKDGVSVANSIRLSDPIQNMAAMAVLDACMKTLVELGDGTTTTAVIVKYLVNRIFRDMDDINTREFLAGMEIAKNLAIEEFAKIVYKEITEEVLVNVATISANNDSELGELIGKMYYKLGEDASVSINYKDVPKAMVEYTSGYVVEGGLMKKDFINDGGSCVMDDARILVTNRSIDNVHDIINIMDYCNKREKPLLIVAGAFGHEVMATITKNIGKMNICTILAPSSGDMRNSFLEDICKYTGASFVDGEKDIFFDDINMFIKNNNSVVATEYIDGLLGTVEKITVNRDDTCLNNEIVVDGFNEHISDLEKMADVLHNDLAIEFTKKRLAKLKNTVATLCLPLLTKTESSFNFDRVDDSLKTTKNALKHGVVAGGGKAYSFVGEKLDERKGHMTPSQTIGFDVVRRSMDSVIDQLLKNGGYNDVDTNAIKKNFHENSDVWNGYDTISNSGCNMLERGILEAGNSPTVCFSNAYSIARTLANIGCSISIVPQFTL